MNYIYILLIWYGFEAIITSQYYFQLPSIFVNSARKVDELIIIVMLIKTLFIYNKKSFQINKSIKNYAYLFLIIVTISGLINLVSIPIIIEYCLRYGKWIVIVFYCHLMFRWTEFHYYKLWKYINIYFVIQLLFNSLWYLDINFIPNARLNHPFDWALGTMGNSFNIALFSSVILSGHIYVVLNFRKKFLKKLNSYILITLSIIQIFWTNTNHLILIIPMLLLLTLFLLPIIRLRYKIITSVLFILLFFNFSTGLKVYDILLTGFERVKYSPKAITYKHSFTTIPNIVPVSILGAGPGEAGSYIGRENESYLTKKFFIKYDIPELRGGSILTTPFTGFNSIQSELGFIGTVVIILLSASTIIALHRKNKFNITFHPFTYNSLFTFITFFFFLLFLIENTLIDLLQHSFFPILTWFFVSISLHKIGNNIYSIKNSFKLN